ncbi:hypothetical protein FSP39_021208 [Pinctada imbricata]|uniref:Uncharacterized protein n=1 Tax=Pinctada imbricata TaxID=66713 RepID=A0AA89C7X1_PINIB|nr:hypothetical protein FSP39_021208 [Pinctada imbricata]
MDIVNPTFPTLSTPKCDIMNSVSCLQTLSRAQQAAANQNQADSAQAVDSLCRSMDAAFMCIGDKLMGCKGKRRLLYDTAVSAGRFLCNGNGRRGFVENYQCLFSEKFKNSSEGCSTNVVTGIVDYVMRSTVTTSGSNDPAEMCRMGQDVSMCIIKTSRKACGENSVTFLRDYLAAAMSPLRQMLACDTPAAIQATPPEPINTVPILPDTAPTEQPTTSTTTQTPTTTTMPTTTTQAPTTTTTTRRPTTTSPVAPVQPVALQTVTSVPVGARSDVTRPIARPPFFSLPPRRRRRRCSGCVANRRNVPSTHFGFYDSVCASSFASSRSQYCPEGICMRTRSCRRTPSRRVICYAVGPLRDLEDSDTWCQRQCPGGACSDNVRSLSTLPEPINTVPILPETTPTEQPTTSTTTTQTPTTTTMLTTTTQAPTTTTRRPTTTSPVAPVQPVTLQTVTSAPVGVRSDVRRPITRPPFFSLPPRRRRRRCYGCVANRRNAESLTAHFDLNTLDSVCALNFASSRSQYCPEGICMRTRSCPRSRSRSRRVICYAVGPLKDLEDSDTWCQRQCPRGACSDNVRSLCNCVLVTQL